MAVRSQRAVSTNLLGEALTESRVHPSALADAKSRMSKSYLDSCPLVCAISMRFERWTRASTPGYAIQADIVEMFVQV